MFLLDTNHCSKLIDGDAEAARGFNEKGTVLVATSVIVRVELMFKVSRFARPDENRARIEAFLRKIGLYLLDEQTADAYGELKEAAIRHFGPKSNLKRRKITAADLGISDNDLWIAATALRHGLTIVSADKDFDRVGQAHPLTVESWLPAPIP